jgi:hypothetical protein
VKKREEGGSRGKVSKGEGKMVMGKQEIVNVEKGGKEVFSPMTMNIKSYSLDIDEMFIFGGNHKP